MVAAGNMDQFINTLAFVQGHEKNYVIQKVCTANQLRGCWQYDYVTLKDGKQWNIADTISGNQFRMTKDDNNDYTGQTVGIVNGDGTTMIISYNTKCATFDPAKTYPYSGFTNATTGCVAIVFDANGSRKPNTVGKDVVLFNANGLGSSCAIIANGKCFSKQGDLTVDRSTCQEMVDSGKYGITSCPYSFDTWAGAVKTCGGIDKLPTESDLANIKSQLYDTNNKLNYDKVHAMGFTAASPTMFMGIWENKLESNEYNAYYRVFYSTISYRTTFGRSFQGMW